MNKNQKNIVMVSALIILGSIAAIQMWIGPNLKSKMTELSQLNADVTAKTNRLSSIKSVKTSLADLETAMSDIEKVGLPNGNALPDLIEQVGSVVTNTKDTAGVAYFEITAFSPSLTSSESTTATNSNTSINFTLSVKGDSDNLIYLLDAFNNNTAPFLIKNFTIAPDSSSSNIVATFNMVAYGVPATTTEGAQ